MPTNPCLETIADNHAGQLEPRFRVPCNGDSDSYVLPAGWAVALIVLICCNPLTSQAENWPSWRGPTSNGISTEQNLPIRWSSTENIVWRIDLPGPGGATPAVWGERIFVTSVEDGQLLLQCIGTDGQQRWKRQVGTGSKDVRGDEGNAASPSPSTDGEHVWVMFANGALACYTVNGDEVWNIQLQDRYGEFQIAFGMTSTPVLDDGQLYLQLIHGVMDENPSRGELACLDGATGEEIWKHVRATDGVQENKHSYASPMMYSFGGDKFLVAHGADVVTAHDIENGAEIWRCGGLNLKSRYDFTLRFVASPACAEGIIVVPSAKAGPCIAIGSDGDGDITDLPENHFWSHARTPDVPSPLILDDLVYLCLENGNLICLDRKSGNPHYVERTRRHRHRASPVFADGHIYTTSRDGVVSVVKAGPTFELVSQNEMGESIAASPVISNGTIYLRSFDALWAIRK